MAKRKGPGKSYRQGISLLEIVKRFDSEEKAEAWFVAQRWPNGIACLHCGSLNVATITNRKPMPYRCRDCRQHFSFKTGTVLQSSKLPLSKWAIGFYLYMTSLKGVSSMKLHRDLGITQKTAWHMAHRIRETFRVAGRKFFGPVEADETYIGGKRKNMHASKRPTHGRGPEGKTAVAGVKDRPTGRVSADVVASTDRPTVQRFLAKRMAPAAPIFTDEATVYAGMPNHQAVRHSVGEFVRGQAHTNGMESFWAGLKRGYEGVYHHMSAKHLGRYVAEFEGRHNDRPLDTIEQMASMARGAEGKRLTYAALIGPPETRQPAML